MRHKIKQIQADAKYTSYYQIVCRFRQKLLTLPDLRVNEY